MKLKTTAIFIALLLLGAGLFINFNQQYELSFTNLATNVELESSTKDRRVLLQGDILSGNLMGEYKNLGQIVVRFFNFNRDSDDILEFRIKESKADDWFYKAKYKTDQFLPDKIFPFGFPVIKDSYGKNYHIEIESLRGATDSGIALSKYQPQAVAIYGFTKAEILSRKEGFAYFVINKFKDVITDAELLSSLILYSLPAVFFFILVFSGPYYIIPFFFIGTILLSEIVSPDPIHLFQYLLVPTLWLALSVKHKLDYKITIYISGLLILFGVVSLFRVRPSLAEIYLSWGYVFLFASFFQIILSQKKLLDTKITPLAFLVGMSRQIRLGLIKSRAFFQFLFSKTRGPVATIIKFFILVILIFITGNLMYKSYHVLIALQRVYSEYYQSQSLIYFLRFNAFRLIILYLGCVFVGFKSYKFYRHLLPAILITIALISFFQTHLIGLDQSTMVEPRISSISPNIIHESWTDVVVNGHNFKNLPFEGRVELSGVDQYLLISWTDNKIVFRTNPDTSTSGDVVVITNDGKRSNEVKLQYTFKY